MLNLRSPREIERMRPAGQCVARAHARVREAIRPGVTTAELDHIVESTLAEVGAQPLFKGVPGVVPFPAATCISVNEQVVHGIPGPRVLQAGDIVSVDTGAKLNGWCGDSAWTYPVGPVASAIADFLRVAQASLELAIDLLTKRRLWSEVAEAMNELVVSHGYSMVEQFVGHGIGREMHEKPQVPNFASDTFRQRGDFSLRTGLVLAIEPMVNQGTKDVRTLEDHWTVVTCDGKLSAHFEHTIALTPDGPLVLTSLDEDFAVVPLATPSKS